MSVSRREVVFGSLAAGGCAVGGAGTALAGPVLSPAPVADAHLHLFNASDLPIAGFVNYVFFSKYVTLPRWAAAAVDLFANFFRSRATTVAQELAQFPATASFATAPRITPAVFGDQVAAAIEARVGGLARAGDKASGDLADSYRALSQAVAADAGIVPAVSTKSMFAASGLAAMTAVNRDTFRMVAEKEEHAYGILPGDVADKSLQALHSTSIPLLGGAARLIGWGYQMLQPRSRHLDYYLQNFGQPDAQPQLVMNHLVDYDLWLGDKPVAQSSHEDQIRLMGRIAQAVRQRADLRTFAGFCPLKHAVESLSGSPTTFDRLKALRAQGLVAGFKLYPPMGFLPIGNSALRDKDFHPAAPGRTTARDAWRAAGGAPGKLGEALDSSLRAFYAYCVAQRIPVMAHAGPGNEAGRRYGARANPSHWRRVVAEYPLRISLGHVVNDAKPFVKAVRKGRPYPTDVWSLHSSIHMLGAQTSPGVYGDLGYMSELISNRSLAKDFFEMLRTAMQSKDPQLTRILYGTDWIMLGREAHNRSYLSAIRQGMADAGYSDMQQRNILFENARRFLG